MRQQNSYSEAVTLVVGTPIAELLNDLPISGILITATVAGNVSLTLAGGQIVVIAVAVGSVLHPLAALAVNTSGTTATATYYALA